MTITYGSNATTALAANARGITFLVEMQFSSPYGTLRYSTAPVEVISGGHTWLGWGSVVGVAPLRETENVNTERLTLTLNVINSALLQIVLADATAYRGKRVVIYDQIFNDSFTVPLDDPVARWTGFMDKVNIVRESAGEAGEPGGRIEMQCTRAGMARARNYEGLRLSHEQHKLEYPTDNGLEYLQKLIEKPVTWLDKDFLRQ